MQAFASAYKTVFQEVPFASCQPSFGQLPSDLKGTYYRAGPAMFSAGSIVPPRKSIVQPKQPPVEDGVDPSRMVLHPFEGDGAVLGVTLVDGSVSVRYRYVRTAAFTNERKKGQRLYTGMDETRRSPNPLANDWPVPLFGHHLQPGLNKKRKNTSNTRAIYWGKRLLTLWQGGQPYKLNAIALSTEGRSRLGGAIRRDEDPLSGKMVVDAAKERAIFFGLEPSGKKSTLTMYEFDKSFRLVEEKGGRYAVDVPGFCVANDFAATENYSVFVYPKVTYTGLSLLISGDPGKVLKIETGPATLALIPRAASKRAVKTLEVPVDDLSDANLQFVNAYEDGDDVVLDAIRSDVSNSHSSGSSPWPWASSLEAYRKNASKKSLWRYTINTKSGSITKELLVDEHCVFGTINPASSAQRHRFVYFTIGALGNQVAPPQGLARFNVETRQLDTWLPESYEFCGEPMFAPAEAKDSEEDGYLLSVMYNGKTKQSELIVLQAKNVASGPITRIPLGLAVPHGLFGCFASGEEARWSAEKIERRAKLADKVESKDHLFNEVKSDFSGLG